MFGMKYLTYAIIRQFRGEIHGSVVRPIAIEEIEHLRGEAFLIEAFANRPASVGPQGSAPRSATQERQHRVSQGLNLAWWNAQRVMSGPNDLRCAPSLADDDRFAARHRLDDSQTERLGPSAGVNDHVQGAINGANIKLKIDEADIAADAEATSQALQLRTIELRPVCLVDWPPDNVEP